MYSHTYCQVLSSEGIDSSVRPSVHRGESWHSVRDVLQNQKFTIAKIGTLALSLSKTPRKVDTFSGQCQYLSHNLLGCFGEHQPLSYNFRCFLTNLIPSRAIRRPSVHRGESWHSVRDVFQNQKLTIAKIGTLAR